MSRPVVPVTDDEVLAVSRVLMDWVLVDTAGRPSRFAREQHAAAIRRQMSQGSGWCPNPNYCKYVWGTDTVPLETTEVLPDA